MLTCCYNELEIRGGLSIRNADHAGLDRQRTDTRLHKKGRDCMKANSVFMGIDAGTTKLKLMLYDAQMKEIRTSNQNTKK